MYLSDNMDLASTHVLLREKSTSDNAKWFQMVYRDMGYADSSSLEDYLRDIENGPESWVNKLPSSIHARSTLNKPKTAVLAALTVSEVVSTIDNVLIATTKTALEKVYKDKVFIALVMKERDVDAASTDGTPSVSEYVTHIAKLEGVIRTLKAVLKSCTKDLPLGEGISMLVDSL
jgi:hypothetical protein